MQGPVDDSANGRKKQEDFTQNMWLYNGEARRNHHQGNRRQKILVFSLCFTGNMHVGTSVGGLSQNR